MMFNLSEAFQACEGRKDFVQNSTDDFLSFDYIVVFNESFSVTDEEIQALKQKYNISQEQAIALCEKFAQIRKQFRGLTFSKDGELLSLPLEKFFNVNQTESTQFDKIKNLNGIICEKVDGSMIHFFLYKDELYASTRSNHKTVQAQTALKLVNQDQKLKEKIINEIKLGYTPIFELVGPQNRIVVLYDSMKLVYLVSRNRNNGSYKFAKEFDTTVKVYDFKFADIEQHLEKENFEGYVCYLENGMIVKRKTPWYLQKHKVFCYFLLPTYKLYDMALDGSIDDLIANCNTADQQKLIDINQEVCKDLLHEIIRIRNVYNYIVSFFPKDFNHKEYKKQFVEIVKKKYNSDFNILVAFFDSIRLNNLEYEIAIKKSLSKKYTELHS